MKKLLAGPLPPDAPKCPARAVRPRLLGGGEECLQGLILSAFTVERAHGEVVAWPSSEKEAIHYAGWYACSHGETVYVVGGGKPIASVSPKEI